MVMEADPLSWSTDRPPSPTLFPTWTWKLIEQTLAHRSVLVPRYQTRPLMHRSSNLEQNAVVNASSRRIRWLHSSCLLPLALRQANAEVVWHYPSATIDCVRQSGPTLVAVC